MKVISSILLALFSLSPCYRAIGAEEPAPTPTDILRGTLARIVNVVEPAPGAAAQTFSTRVELLKTEGLPKSLAGQSATLAFQAPDRLTVATTISGNSYSAGRDQQQLWFYAPSKQFGLVGKAGVARFASAPEKKDTTKLADFKLPLPKEQLALLPLLTQIEQLPSETNGSAITYVLHVTPKPEAIEALKLPAGRWTFWIQASDSMPTRIAYADAKGLDVEARLADTKVSDAWPEEKWKIPAREGDKIETTALSHLAHFIPVALSSLDQKIPTLGPATGERRVVAREGEGRLELIDGTRVLFLKGSPEEMGRQHGTLLKKEIHELVDRILYGVGVGSSFLKGKWFFGEIEQAQSRISPFIDERYLQEMDAIALASNTDKEEVRLANFFPELFHCSGFALFGDATVGGHLFHGRILDYLKGVGLEQNAVVMVMQPRQGNAWVNVSYSGFVGSVTAMNEKRVAIGEMGGRGQGKWDGKPMAQLVREVMERADTIDEALEIMRKGPRTCEYYYVVSDGKTKRAAGIAATPETFETIWAGQSHAKLPHAIKDAVLMSAGDRYEKLAERVKAGYGKIDADSARDLMKRPVCMNSNIHSVLFEPDTLDFWVANADSKSVASDARYTHYNLAELLKPQPAVTASRSPAQPASNGKETPGNQRN